MKSDLKEKIRTKSAVISVVGLGYVGLPTGVLFAKKGFRVLGCEVKDSVVEMVNSGRCPLSGLNIDDDLKEVVDSGSFRATSDTKGAVRESDIVLIAVPTPTKDGFEPDLVYVQSAGEAIAQGLKGGHLIILESTVYPGVTEEILKPILEKSGMVTGRDFGLAYCPERFNPGDSRHTIDRVTRVLGAVSEEWAAVAEDLYSQITKVHRVPNIRTAEMAKIIENTQRDLNIALMNEVAIICERLGLDVMDVIAAAATKWNFNVYYPGSGVGGHCLPKDPWYLIKAAEKRGYHAQLIAAGRRVNDGMPHHLLGLLTKGMNDVGKALKGSTVVLLGLSYKENIGDIRNSPALALVREIRKMGGKVRSVDPFVDEKSAKEEFGVDSHSLQLDGVFDDADAVILLTAHSMFLNMNLPSVAASMASKPLFVDGRRSYPPKVVTDAGFSYIGVGLGRPNCTEL